MPCIKFQALGSLVPEKKAFKYFTLYWPFRHVTWTIFSLSPRRLQNLLTIGPVPFEEMFEIFILDNPRSKVKELP